MIRKLFFPVLALMGVLFAGYTVMTGGRPVTAAPPVAPPSQAPYHTYVAGAGLVEASSENIAVGTTVAGIVTEVDVKVGDAVKSGQPLFKVDDRQLQADLLVRKAVLASAHANVNAQKITLADFKNQLELIDSVADERAVSREEKDRRRFATEGAAVKLIQAQYEVQSVQASIDAIYVELDRLIVRAPVDGEVLQVKVRRGEFAPTGVLQTPLMLIGSVDPLHVRVDVDENDAWRVPPDGKATAFMRGNTEMQTDLKFVRVEPFIVPKKSLSGDSTERVDTRVLQILYSFHRSEKLPVFVGQQMDVYIEAPGLSGAIASNTTQPDK